MSLISIDPGVRGCGCAYWEDGLLKAATYVKARGDGQGQRAQAWLPMAKAVSEWAMSTVGGLGSPICVIELPRVYPGARQKGDQNDLIELAAVVGAIVAMLDVLTAVMYPYEWKGQVPKKIHHERAKKRLSAEELSTVTLPSAKGLQHNVYDAIALGLVHLDRL